LGIPDSLVDPKASIFLSRVGRTYVPHEVQGFGSLEPFPFFLYTFEKKKVSI
jgi:hypothetical protein